MSQELAEAITTGVEWFVAWKNGLGAWLVFVSFVVIGLFYAARQVEKAREP